MGSEYKAKGWQRDPGIVSLDFLLPDSWFCNRGPLFGYSAKPEAQRFLDVDTVEDIVLAKSMDKDTRSSFEEE